MTDPALCRAISARLAAAASSGEVGRILEAFTADATIWHNITGRSCSAGEAAAMFSAMVELVRDIRYEDVRITPLADGYIQQHRLRGQVGDQQLDVPACIVCRVRGDRICALHEYLDSAALSRAGLVLAP